VLTYSRFPARVLTSDGTELNRCAVVVIDGHAQIAVQRPSGGMGAADGIQTIATLDGAVLASAGAKSRLEAPDGQWWEVSEGDGCGCRSPLQAWYAKALAGQRAGT
jgi:hypothetical protein